ncbi:hypothetical protein C8R44DRAFT_882295 [Mycena epipterygia]|nr:hypothetical protein C8R44DRAFT_882295 [Mycena epipterygia]
MSLASAPCEDGHDGLSQCELNKEVDIDSKFEIGFGAANGVPFGTEPRWSQRDLWGCEAYMDLPTGNYVGADCVRRGRVIVHQSIQNASHAFAAASGSKFNTPDLTIAFNSGFFDIATASWLETVRLLIAQKIPTVFTSYDRQEAQEEARLLREADAQLQPPWDPAEIRGAAFSFTPSPTKCAASTLRMDGLQVASVELRVKNPKYGTCRTSCTISSC